MDEYNINEWKHNGYIGKIERIFNREIYEYVTVYWSPNGIGIIVLNDITYEYEFLNCNIKKKIRKNIPFILINKIKFSLPYNIKIIEFESEEYICIVQKWLTK
ncbi:hypothetical protein TCON_1941 [Astathelohania contejeani]|uniref:Uncharacterized protein n=1 Tax=Astathelohania contejeani TaxID=164912 RepID=A0ABQ7HXK6_9MICR|nr:hypothetical protein TCON_1941 [Thelohania contejeani]